jgi:5-formyltetrahydrofolate cyclo-ligase
MDKSELRTHFCSLRECLPAEKVALASAAICRQLAHWLPNQLTNHPTNQSSILTYLAFRNEPDLSLLFELLPDTRWVVPRITEGRQMALHPYDPGRLVRHRFGMLEPTADLPVVDPAKIDVVLVPGVAFDRHGRRLGFGGGYYDRFLYTTSALRIGIAFDECLADEIPCGAHDQRMDWVATPSEMINCEKIEWESS